MYTRRDAMKVLFGAAAVAAVPNLIVRTSIAEAQVAVISPLGDLLPKDGGWIKISEFPDLAEYLRFEHASTQRLLPKGTPVALLERDGMIQLPHWRPYAQRAGLTADGEQIWKHYTNYIKAIPTEDNLNLEQDLSYGHRVGWDVQTVHYSVGNAPPA